MRALGEPCHIWAETLTLTLNLPAGSASSPSQQTFEWLERSLQKRDFWLLMLAHDPGFDFLRKDPRFSRIVERVGVGRPLTPGD